MAIILEPGKTKTVNVQLTPLPPEPATLVVNVSVAGDVGIGIRDAHVQIVGTGGGYEGYTDSMGQCKIENIVPGTYEGQVTHPDYEPYYF